MASLWAAAVDDPVGTPFERRTDFHHWNRFAAVTGEFYDLHQDDEIARERGLQGAFGPYSLLWSYLHSFLREAAGPAATIGEVQCDLRAPNRKGAHLAVYGWLATIAPDQASRTVELVIKDIDADEDLVVGWARVVRARDQLHS